MTILGLVKMPSWIDFATGLTYLWYACIMADLLDKEGREILDRFNETYPLEEAPGAATEDDHKNRVLSWVLLQNEGNARIYLAFQLYVELQQAIALFFEEDSIEWLWVTNRLAGVAVLLGLREEAKDMYGTVIEGRRKHLGDHNKATLASVKYAEELILVEPEYLSE
jgi:hypothetical protein